MSDTKTAAEALTNLATSNTARTKMGRLRELLPQIEMARKAGVTHQNILDTLNQKGFDLSFKAYSVMVHRVRQQATKKTTPVLPLEAPTTRTFSKEGQASAPTRTGETSTRPGEPSKFDWEALQTAPVIW